jgi:exonuclease SbcD
MGKSREAEHRAFLNWIIEQAQQHRVDALIVAGDLFDTGTPPSYARRLYNQFIADLRSTGCQLVILGGNHDSVSTLHESRELLACLDTRVVGGVAATPEEQVIVLHRRDGLPGAVLCAIPYLRPRDLIESHAGESPGHKREALMQAIGDHYTVIYDTACDVRRRLQGGVDSAQAGCAPAVSAQAPVGPLPIIATGHLTCVGGQLSESVRELYIGTLEAYPASAFPPADYIALGHLHRAQAVGGQSHIRYSGSPIALSFDESQGSKQVLLVDFAAGQLADVRPLPVPVWQPMQGFGGTLEELERQLQQHFDPAAAGSPDAGGPRTWLEIEVRGDDYLSDLQPRVQQLVEGLPVEVLRIRRQRSPGAAALEREHRETLQELSVREVFGRRLAQEEAMDEATQARLVAAFEALLEQVQDTEKKA